MPCPHNEITIVQRSQQQSAVAAAAYQSGEKLFCEYDQEVKHYPEKRGIVHNEILLPANAPPEYADRNTLWNAAEAVEKQWNSQLARRWVLTIPREIPPDQYAVLVREFCEQQFVSKGMIADFAIHDPHPPGHNPHAHVLLTMRAMDEHGKWLPKSRKVYDLDENGERIKLPSGRWKSHKEDTPEPELPSCRNPDFGKTEVKSSEKPKSGPRKIRSQDLGKTECNKTDKNNTELSNTDSSIHPGAQPEEVIEGYRKEIRENIEYDHLRRQHPYDDIDEIADLMLEVLCTQGSFMWIGGKQLYTALVKERFLKLDSSHIEYVLDCLRESTVTLGTDVFGNLQRMDNALEGLPIKEQACREQLSNLQTQLETAKAEVQKPFPREAELNTKTARLEELNTLLNLDHKEPEIVDAEPDEDQRPPERRRPQLER